MVEMNLKNHSNLSSFVLDLGGRSPVRLAETLSELGSEGILLFLVGHDLFSHVHEGEPLGGDALDKEVPEDADGTDANADQVMFL